MSLSDDLESKVIEFLAIIYGQIPWGKIKTRVNPWDIYNHRVRAAARQGALFKFASRLANYFGLQHLPPRAVDLLTAMRDQEIKVLNAIYTEHIPLCMLAIQKHKKSKEKANEANDAGSPEI